MTDERSFEPTYSIDRICWLDFESWGDTNLKAAGAYRYAASADALILAYAIGSGPVQVVHAGGRALDLADLPTELLAFIAKVETGTAVFAAWNAGFDRAIWNYAGRGFPYLAPHRFIDVMAQAAAAGLPPDLASAARMCGSGVEKDKRGAALIKLFCLPDSEGSPASHPEQWAEFLAYAHRDIEAMRAVFLHTRQLALAELREYWAMEAVNERGIAIDMTMVANAAKLAIEDKGRSQVELMALTSGLVDSVDQVARITTWLLRHLPPEGRGILTERVEEIDDEGVLVKPARYALTRGQVERLIAFVQAPENARDIHNLPNVLRVLQLRLYGGSKTPAKFNKMLQQQVEGTLFGQYVFNGAAQTGRASSRGVQIHNLARDVLPAEAGHIGALLAGVDYDTFDQLDCDMPVARQLSLLIRPTFVPSGSNVFVWSDWSQIEARVLPWVVGDDEPGAAARLDIFRDVDRDPGVADIYTRTAATLSHCTVAEVTKPMRQRGKVAELALGFGGGKGALLSMAAGYGLHITDEEAKLTVEAWRAANKWCERFWQALEKAVEEAMICPGLERSVGRVTYVYLRDYLGGSLVCVLPSGRLLTYRAIRRDRVEELDDDDKPTGRTSIQLRFSRGHGRVKLWRGMLCENIVQAVAADVLRGTLRRLVQHALDVRAHTHDEIILECPAHEADEVAAQLRGFMRKGFDWSEGLPLMSEETQAYYYTKDAGGHGL